MKQYAEHGKVGICHSLRTDNMYQRVFSGGYPYLRSNLIIRSSSLEPIYSYGKNYEKNGKKFAFFVWTTEKDSSVIEKQFDSLLDKVTNEQVTQVSNDGSFIYL